MIDTKGIGHHPAVAEIVEVLCNKTQNRDKVFFRTVVAYSLAKMAASMRATIVTKDRGEIPTSIYALALASSGYGKGFSVNIIEQEFIKGFEKRYVEETLPTIAHDSMWDIANDRAVRSGKDQAEEFKQVEKEYASSGAYAFTFDSGTVPAVKQFRTKLLIAESGSINLQVDEIGSNLINASDLLVLMLELYDQGMVKQKLTKNTAENQRMEEMGGKTPSNALLFGTPSKLLDGGTTEDQFYSFLETGYARRCIFGVGQQKQRAAETMSPAEIFASLTTKTNSQTVDKWHDHFITLADPVIHGWRMDVPDDVSIELIAYKVACEDAADEMKEHEDIRKAEISHRYFKALKLAGVYAFIDNSSYITMDHLHQAILLVEESGQSFQAILNREKAYVKLAKYIADVGTEVTHADLMEALPFYTSGAARRNEMMSLATAWGYKNHTIIKKTFADGVELFQGEKLKETNIDEMIISCSDHYAYDYIGEEVPFDQLHNLTQAAGYNWCNHHFRNDHRKEENALAGFNLIVIDVDGGTPMDVAMELLKDYKFLAYTTKRHTEEEHRYRIVLPINYIIKLDSADYKEFMDSILAWLPFKADAASNQRSKKWLSHAEGEYHYNLEGEVLDALGFIPKTSRSEQQKGVISSLASLDNLERWFAQRMLPGQRSNEMIKFALALVYTGMAFVDVEAQVLNFNKKLANPLPQEEIENTILRTVAQHIRKVNVEDE